MDPLKHCVLCKTQLESRKHTALGQKGLGTLLEFSKSKGDNLGAELAGQSRIYVHNDCRKNYTDKRKLPKKPQSLQQTPGPSRLLRSQLPSFQFTEMCFLCAEKLPDEDELRKHPDRHQVSFVKDADQLRNIHSQALKRSDAWGQVVSVRLDSTLSQFQSKKDKARYHRSCFSRFSQKSSLSPTPSPLALSQPKATGRPTVAKKDEAFRLICFYIDSSDECQFTIRDLYTKMKELSRQEDEDLYSERYLQSKLLYHYNTNVMVSEKDGSATILCFKGNASKIFREKWLSSKKSLTEADERMRTVESAAVILQEEIRMQVHNTEDYPSPQDVLKSADSAPELLKLFVRGLVGKKRATSSKLTPALTNAEHILMNLCRPRSFPSSLHFAVALFIHNLLACRQLIDLLHSLGVSSSYRRVINFESKVAEHAPPAADPHEFVQYVWDNADFNIHSYSGHGTFHSMGGIRVQTPATKSSGSRLSRGGEAEPTRTRSASIPVLTYRARAGESSGLSQVKVKRIETFNAEASIKLARSLDCLWLSGPWIEAPHPPSWAAFMTSSTKNCTNFETSSIQPLPFVNLNPSNPSSVYSCLKFSVQECRKREQKHCIVTFDQPLYAKASEIVLANPEEFQEVILRLGGFHTLVSFMGTIGNFMSASGLEDLWETIYAKNSIPHMMSGHHYARAVRAHSLTQLAVVTTLLRESEELSLQDTINLRRMFCKVSEGQINNPLEVSESPEVVKLTSRIETALKAASESGRTARLWMQYVKQVDLVRQFIRAERTGDWVLHLETLREMLPYFHAAFHINYAKTAHLYLQQMKELELHMDPFSYHKFTKSGFFTIRRSKKFWAGVWSDMTIEQTLMKDMKSRGELTRGRGFSADTIDRWVSSMPIASEFRRCLEQFCGQLSAGTTDQHVEMRESRQKRDQKDFEILSNWLMKHSPFQKDPQKLVSLSSGIIASDEVNCDLAVEIGLRSMEEMKGKPFSDVHFSKKNKVVSLSSVNKTVKIRGENIPVNPSLLFHRIICVVRDDSELSSCLAFELSPRPASLFDDHGFMRKGNKSALIDVLKNLCAGEQQVTPVNASYTVDGGYLLHKVVWATPSSFRDICTGYVSFIRRHFPRDPYVVFDGYSRNTKDEEHLRRTADSGCPTIEIDMSTSLCHPKAKFLSNVENKKNFISLLKKELGNAKIKVFQAEGDADTLIVKTALKRAQRGKKQIIVGEDTDLVVLMIALARDIDISLQIPRRSDRKEFVFSSQALRRKLGVFSDLMLFFHAITGCDTTSAIFRKGKKFCFEKLLKSEHLRDLIEAFNSPEERQQRLVEAGEAFLLHVFGATNSVQSLNELRFISYQRTIARLALSSKFELASLPPTSGAAAQHILRTYLQVQEWLGNSLDPLDWGWQLQNEVLRPVPTLENVAPEYLVSLIACNCKANCDTMRCECRRAGLSCTPMCGFCSGSCSNGPPIQASEDDWENDDLD